LDTNEQMKDLLTQPIDELTNTQIIMRLQKTTEQYIRSGNPLQWKELDDMIWLINDRIGEMYEQIESMEMSIVGLGMEMHKLYGYKS